ncbi:MAG: acetolactate synthase-1/2/3 large subunit [Rhodococcus sp. (in: high G+C Gram-positive bacteria)]
MTGVGNRKDLPESVSYRMAGARALEFTLIGLGVEIVFDSSGRRVVESEVGSGYIRYLGMGEGRAAGYAAVGYAQATGKVGVCIARSASDATDLVTPLVDAQRDSVSLVALTFQVESGERADRMLDISGMTIPIAKHSILLTVANDLPRILAEAFHIASTGRPGVVVIDISENLLHQLAAFSWPPVKHLLGYRPRRAPNPKQIRAAVCRVLSARAPVLYVGGGAVLSGAAVPLYQWVELTGVPVVTTTMARGVFPDSHRLHYGMPGIEGAYAANQALHHSDLVIALGASFDSYVTETYESFAPGAHIIQVDIDPSEIGRSFSANLSIVGDCAYTITALIDQFLALRSKYPVSDLSSWVGYLDQLQANSRSQFESRADRQLSAEFVVEKLSQLTPAETVYVSEAGPHRALAANRPIYERPRLWLNSGSPHSHGYALSAAIGARMGVSGAVWVLADDRSFLFATHSLATAVAEGVPIKIALLNSGADDTEPPARTVSNRAANLFQIAQGSGCHTFRCESEEQVEDAVRSAQTVDDRPVLIDFMLAHDSTPAPERASQNVDSSKSMPRERIFR